jgi:23S rRNA pseudouridine2457 synthase
MGQNNANDCRYFVLHKPINMVSQFISPHKVRLLGDVDFDWPEGTHAIGRLDSPSEGLLILTTDRRITKLLYNSETKHFRTYVVRVSYVVTEAALESLRNGISILIRGNTYWTTTPCDVKIIEEPKNLAPINEPKEYIPHSWLQITLTEGKFRQVRKMCLAAGHKCKRLIRTSIEDLELGDLPAGEVREYSAEDFFRLLKITQ